MYLNLAAQRRGRIQNKGDLGWAQWHSFTGFGPDGRLWAWGDNAVGYLVPGDITNRYLPTQVTECDGEQGEISSVIHLLLND